MSTGLRDKSTEARVGENYSVVECDIAESYSSTVAHALMAWCLIKHGALSFHL